MGAKLTTSSNSSLVILHTCLQLFILPPFPPQAKKPGCVHPLVCPPNPYQKPGFRPQARNRVSCTNPLPTITPLKPGFFPTTSHST
ncbi:hypothetical protein [Spirulina subsalsa]|uniref:hypothetical protein n=1 Tax=Spirulina subsalsa TaxID=54311 RepID=UPI000317E0C3|nr:hypothetical protein [Spirulina subsalsa]